MTETRHIERTLLVDADDTLWENNIYYLACAGRFLDFIEEAGFDRQEAEARFRAIERALIPELGYGPDLFLVALERTFEELKGSLEPDERARARGFGNPVLVPPVELLDEVEPTLKQLRSTSRLVLVTKGDEGYQRDKIRRSGLAPLFDAVYVVPEKDRGLYRCIVSELELDPARTWMVGNSPRSDINPAVEAGLSAVFIPHAHTWEEEDAALAGSDRVTRIERFEDLLTLFGPCRG